MMPDSSSRAVNRIPQVVLLVAAGLLVIFLVLLGTEAISPGDAATLIIAGSLFAIALGAMAAEFEINRTGFSKNPPRDEGE